MKKVQGFRGHPNDAEYVICIICPNDACSFRQGVTEPGPYQCHCGAKVDVVAHPEWVAKGTKKEPAAVPAAPAAATVAPIEPPTTTTAAVEPPATPKE